MDNQCRCGGTGYIDHGDGPLGGLEQCGCEESLLQQLEIKESEYQSALTKAIRANALAREYQAEKLQALRERDEAQRHAVELAMQVLETEKEREEARQANAALLEGLRKIIGHAADGLGGSDPEIMLDQIYSRSHMLFVQYATPEPTCKTCHDVGDVTLTVMRQPDEYENVPCPDCQGSGDAEPTETDKE